MEQKNEIWCMLFSVWRVVPGFLCACVQLLHSPSDPIPDCTFPFRSVTSTVGAQQRIRPTYPPGPLLLPKKKVQLEPLSSRLPRFRLRLGIGFRPHTTSSVLHQQSSKHHGGQITDHDGHYYELRRTNRHGARDWSRSARAAPHR